MTKEQFFDWISGYFDICEPDRIGVVETQIIKDHIDLVRGEAPHPVPEAKEYDCFENEEFVKSISKRMQQIQSKEVTTNWVKSAPLNSPSPNITVC